MRGRTSELVCEQSFFQHLFQFFNWQKSLSAKFMFLFKTLLVYRKIPVISPDLIFVQKSFLLGIFWGEPIFGGVHYWKEFCVAKWVGLDNKNSL